MTDYTCNRDRNGWQLYNIKGAEKAALKLSSLLTSKVREAKALLKQQPLLSEKKIAQKIADEMYEEMGKVDDFGATDTEPRGVLCSEVEKAFGLDDYDIDV